MPYLILVLPIQVVLITGRGSGAMHIVTLKFEAGTGSGTMGASCGL